MCAVYEIGGVKVKVGAASSRLLKTCAVAVFNEQGVAGCSYQIYIKGVAGSRKW